jgi:hypothetical protein
MRVLETGRRLDLGQESLGTDDRRELGLQHLERDVALVPHVIGEVDRSHPALAQLSIDPVAALQGRVEAGDGIGHEMSRARREKKGQDATRSEKGAR